MRVGIDASSMRGGGSVTHLIEVLNATQAQDFDIDQVTVWAGRETIDRLPKVSWISPVHVPLLDQPLISRVYWQRVKLSDLAEKSCDLLFVPSGTYSGTFYPFVTMSHNLLPFEINERRRYGISWQRLRLNILERIQTKTFHKADGIIFLTDYARKTVELTTGSLSARIAIIPHGVSQRFFREPRPQKGLSTYSLRRPFRWLYVSAVNVYKHQWHVAEAIAKLRLLGYPVALDLIGSAYAPSLDQLRRTVRRVDPEESFIRYLGEVDYHILDQYYANADGFIFASSCENMPNILLEAMAAGLPIASSQLGPMPEILGNSACFFDPYDPNDLARKLQRMLEDTKLRADNARKAHQLSQHYSWDSTARQIFTFFANVANAHRNS